MNLVNKCILSFVIFIGMSLLNKFTNVEVFNNFADVIFICVLKAKN